MRTSIDSPERLIPVASKTPLSLSAFVPPRLYVLNRCPTAATGAERRRCPRRLCPSHDCRISRCTWHFSPASAARAPKSTSGSRIGVHHRTQFARMLPAGGWSNRRTETERSAPCVMASSRPLLRLVWTRSKITMHVSPHHSVWLDTAHHIRGSGPAASVEVNRSSV